jgi:hypothetical protein
MGETTMKHLLLCLLALLLSSCMSPIYPVPLPPGPVVVEPPQPEPQQPGVRAVAFQAFKAGDAATALEGLPEPERKTPREGGGEIWSWRLEDRRPDGGQVRWEIHIKGGFIIATFAF